MVLPVVGVLVLAGCTSSDTPPKPTGGGTRTITSTLTGTRDTGTGYRPPAASELPNLRPGARPPMGETEGSCPYIRTGLDQDPTSKPNVADIEGNRIYRTTRLTTLTPIGCRFYFYAPPYNPTADIRPQTFPDAQRAYNAMILTARAGRDATTYKNFSAGLTGISYRTKFDKGEGYQDWAFVFVKGRVMVVVHTSQNRSASARYFAQAIAAKF